MRSRKLIVGSVAVLALAVPASASATGSCNSDDRSQSQCGSQTASTNQKAVAKSGFLGISQATNSSLTLQALKQRQRRGISFNLIAL
jgi:hypothetical protein